uniref:Uncharacterized protein n=1 Tax=Romanomermis culicivorax TaxID=13658 RepID=A0A915J5S7_ROMCU
IYDIKIQFSTLRAEQSEKPKIYLCNQNFSQICKLQPALCKKTLPPPPSPLAVAVSLIDWLAVSQIDCLVVSQID